MNKFLILSIAVKPVRHKYPFILLMLKSFRVLRWGRKGSEGEGTGEERRGVGTDLEQTHNNFTTDRTETILAFSSCNQTTASFLPLAPGQKETFQRFFLPTSFTHISHRFERKFRCCWLYRFWQKMMWDLALEVCVITYIYLATKPIPQQFHCSQEPRQINCS